MYNGIQKNIARKTFALRKRLGLARNKLHATEDSSVSLEKLFANSYACRLNIDLFIKERDEAVGAITSCGNFMISGWVNNKHVDTEELSISCDTQP